jgi:hypothetical protein
MEAQFDEAVQTGASLPTPTTARQYIDQITMYQELFCSAAPNQAFIRKAILLWTFKKCKAGEQGVSTWRYLEPSPPRSACFSPHPGNTDVVSATMVDNFTAWASSDLSNAQSLQLPSSTSASIQDPFDPLGQFDSLPTQVLHPDLGGHQDDMGGVGADIHFPFAGFGGYAGGGGLSFMAGETQDGEGAVVDDQGLVSGGSGGGGHLDSQNVNLDFLSTAGVGMGVLGGFSDQVHDQGMWETGTPGMVQGFESDPFLAGYSALPTNTGGQIWDGGDGKSDSSWDVNVGVGDGGFGGFDAAGHLGSKP